MRRHGDRLKEFQVVVTCRELGFTSSPYHAEVLFLFLQPCKLGFLAFARLLLVA